MSFIDLDTNIAFVHVPITSGAIWCRWLGREGHILRCAAHDSADFLRNRFPQLWEPATKVAFVRNPWAWWLSAYYHYDFSPYPTFRDFLLRRDEWYRSSFPITGQWEMICNGSGRVLVDYLGRTEALQEGCDWMTAKANLPRIELPTKPRRKLTDFYDDELRKIVAKMAAKDIEIFKYRFEDHP